MPLPYLHLSSLGITSPFLKFCLGPCCCLEVRSSFSTVLSLEECVMGMASHTLLTQVLDATPRWAQRGISKQITVTSSLAWHVSCSSPTLESLGKNQIPPWNNNLPSAPLYNIKFCGRSSELSPLHLCEAGQQHQSTLQPGNRNSREAALFLCHTGTLAKQSYIGLLQYVLNDLVWILSERFWPHSYGFCIQMRTKLYQFKWRALWNCI